MACQGQWECQEEPRGTTSYNRRRQAKVRQVSSDDRLLDLEGQPAVGSPASNRLALLLPPGLNAPIDRR